MTARAIVVSICLLAGSFLIGRASHTERVPARESLATFPMDVGAWRGESGPRFNQQILAVLGVEEYVNRAYYAPGGQAVGLYIGYYGSQREGDTIHSPLNCLPGAGWEPVRKERVAVDVPINAGPDLPGTSVSRRTIVVNRITIQKGLDRQVVLYWYQAHDRVVASEYWGRFYAVLDAIRLNRTDGAMVRLIAGVDPGNPASEAEAGRLVVEFAKSIFPLLGRYLPG